MKCAILSPHYDDAVLSCWQLLEGPDDAIVVNVFTASPPVGTPPPWWDRETGATDPVERMRERREEDAAALALAGTPSVHLGLLDDQYRHEALSVHPVAELIRTRVGPDATLYAPGAFDGHPDHVLVRGAALELARLGWPVVIYADLPHAITRGWPAWVSGELGSTETEIASDWSLVLAEAGLAADRLVPSVQSLDPQTRARKLRALAAYRTQRAALDRFGSLPLDDPRALAWEVSWEVTASALGGVQELVREAIVADSPRESLDNRV
jgi:LmbE family N-acetylglucosaminyl deacetylase